jgi:hypothetical protein
MYISLRSVLMILYSERYKNHKGEEEDLERLLV